MRDCMMFLIIHVQALKSVRMKFYFTLCIYLTMISVVLGLRIPMVDTKEAIQLDHHEGSLIPIDNKKLDVKNPNDKMIFKNYTRNRKAQVIYYNNMTDFQFLQSWNRLCKTSQKNNSTVNIECSVTIGSNLNFVDLRQFTLKLVPDISIDLFIICVGGYVSFPWPFRADKLNRVHIKNCIIKHFRTEFKKAEIESIPDTIKYFVMENIRIVSTVKELHDSRPSLNSHLTRPAECGPENAISIIRRNISIHYEDIQNFKHIYKQNTNFNLQRKTCLYRNLESLEISGTVSIQKITINKIATTDEAWNLKVLNLSHCRLYGALNKLNNWRLRFPIMHTLDLSYNNIHLVPDIRDYGNGKTESSVGMIDLRYNKISLMTKDMINSFSKHKFVMVDIRENPYHCDCRTIDIVKYLESKTLPNHYQYLKTLTCVSPVNVHRRIISSLSREELKCSHEEVINIPVIVLSSIIIVLFTITVVMIYFRNVIQVILYTRMNIRCQCHYKQDEMEPDDKDYDAFIAYSESDADWVLHTALPKLETGGNGKSFKLCLHHRDFIIGAAVADNIYQSVQNSLHTILVVSNNFIKSEWCMMEFRTALEKSLQDKNRHLIIVIKGEVNLVNVDADFKTCISTHTYLKIGDLLFWDKLTYALSFRHGK